MNAVTITRRELYQQLWSEATTRVAKRYGLSDVGMAKLCRKHDIPRPPRGYWAKKRFGKAPPQIPLPNPEPDYEIQLRNPSECRISSPRLNQDVQERVAQEKEREPKITVAESLRGSHRLISEANQQLQRADTDDNRLIVPPKGAVLDIRVSKSSLRRSLLIMDALLKALEQRGFVLGPGPNVTILDVRVGFGMTEQLETQREQPQEHDLDGPYTFGHSRFYTKRVPTGRLVLRIHDADAYWAHGCRQSWRDGKKQRLEDRLNSVVSGLVEVAARRKEHEAKLERQARERREQERQRQEEARRRAEKREQIKAEQARVNVLLQQAENWRKSQVLRNYIETARLQHLSEHGRIEEGSDFARWLGWAVQQADRLDPLVDSPPSILDEPVEEDEPQRPGISRWWSR